MLSIFNLVDGLDYVGIIHKSNQSGGGITREHHFITRMCIVHKTRNRKGLHTRKKENH